MLEGKKIEDLERYGYGSVTWCQASKYLEVSHIVSSIKLDARTSLCVCGC